MESMENHGTLKEKQQFSNVQFAKELSPVQNQNHQMEIKKFQNKQNKRYYDCPYRHGRPHTSLCLFALHTPGNFGLFHFPIDIIINLLG